MKLHHHFGHYGHGHGWLGFGALLVAAVTLVFGVRVAGAVLQAFAALFLIALVVLAAVVVWSALQSPPIGAVL